MLKFFSKLLDTNQKEISRLSKLVEQINGLEPEYKKFRVKDFPRKTQELKKRIEDGEPLESLLAHSFALVREAAVRTLGQRPFDVQLMASIALFEGKVAEQKTGEGKTLSAVPALYLRALTGKGVHLVTVNDYLARIGAGWNAPIFDLLGLTTGVIIQENKSYLYDPKFNDPGHGDERLAHLVPAERKQVYSADVTYGTNNEFGFDYLRDNMVTSIDQMVQRSHYFAIVDEVDSVLIDEARTPLIISAPDTDPTDKYFKFANIVKGLNSDTDYEVDEKSRSATLTEHGITKVEKLLGVDNLYEKDYESIHHIENALRARSLYIRDKDYIVKEGQVTIVDEFTGRLMFGRRWSDGLHQAVEAKEEVAIQRESKTLATISFQNYFRMYDHLSGMTGTAATEADEFKKIYNLDVVVLPTNKPMVRSDLQDTIYKTLRAKYGAIVAEIQKRHNEGQPVLVGTTSIEKNEIIASYLKKKKIPHNMLNAKNHEREASIIAQAGNPGAVTVATNMAGRGVDIVLGGAMPVRESGIDQKDYLATGDYKKWKSDHEKVINAGGLHVIGTERHESRRIDNQLGGCSGRQGDPGSSLFYLSLEDDLMRIFGGEAIKGIMDRLNLPENQPIENRLISRAIEQAQVKVEGFHFDIRKRLVEFDDVANQQRDIIYKLRRKILETNNVGEEVMDKLSVQVEKILSATSSDTGGNFDHEKAVIMLTEIVPFDDESRKRIESNIQKQGSHNQIREFMLKVIDDVHEVREKQVGDTAMRQIEKYAYLGAIDHMWIEHIDRIDDLREGINLRAYGQRDPLVEFKNEAYELFEGLLGRIDDELSKRVFRLFVAAPQQEIPLEQARENVDRSDMMGLAGGADVTAAAGEPAFERVAPVTSHQPPITKHKLGRNNPCWCGSGKKWKKCHYPQMG